MRWLLVAVLVGIGCSSGSSGNDEGTGGSGGSAGSGGAGRGGNTGLAGAAGGGIAGSGPTGVAGSASGGAGGAAAGGGSGGSSGTTGSAGAAGTTGGAGAAGTTGGAGASGGAAGASLSTRLDVSLDQTSLTTELGTKTMFTITLTPSNGFSGNVDLVSSVLDANGPIAGWKLDVDTQTVTVGPGTAVAHATLTLPTKNVGLAGTVKITANSAAMTGTRSATAAVTVLNRYTIAISTATIDGSIQCVYPPAGAVSLTIGTTVRFLNASADTNINIHFEGNANGCPHQDVGGPGAPPGGTYECTLSGGPGDPLPWYCHAPGPKVTDRIIQPVAP